MSGEPDLVCPCIFHETGVFWVWENATKKTGIRNFKVRPLPHFHENLRLNISERTALVDVSRVCQQIFFRENIELPRIRCLQISSCQFAAPAGKTPDILVESQKRLFDFGQPLERGRNISLFAKRKLVSKRHPENRKKKEESKDRTNACECLTDQLSCHLSLYHRETYLWLGIYFSDRAMPLLQQIAQGNP